MGHDSWNYLPRLLIFPFELYCFARPFLGDLIPKGENCGSKQGIFPRGKDIFQRGRNAEWIKSTYERRVVNRGRRKGGIIALGGGQTNIGWW